MAKRASLKASHRSDRTSRSGVDAERDGIVHATVLITPKRTQSLAPKNSKFGQRSTSKTSSSRNASTSNNSTPHRVVKKTLSSVADRGKSGTSTPTSKNNVTNFFNSFRKRSVSSRASGRDGSLDSNPDSERSQQADELTMFMEEVSQERIRKYDLPSREGLDFATVAKWAKGTLKELLAHDKGRQMFQHYLQQSLADENLLFYDAVEYMSRMHSNNDSIKIQKLADTALTALGDRLNLKTELIQEMEAAAAVVPVDMQPFLIAQKDIYRLMSSDQFSRFKISPLYLEYLESLLSFTDVIEWAMSFDAMLANHIGNWRFRRFLKQLKQEEKLKFVEAVNEFREQQEGSKHQQAMAKDIFRQYCKSREGAKPPATEMSALEQDQLWAELDSDKLNNTIFDAVYQRVEHQLRGGQYVAFLNSSGYRKLLKALC